MVEQDHFGRHRLYTTRNDVRWDGTAIIRRATTYFNRGGSGASDARTKGESGFRATEETCRGKDQA
jgi:hypothetical protein